METRLTRSVGFTVSRAEPTDDDGLTLEGVAAVFGEIAHIKNWEGDFDEQIIKGAFAKTLREQTPLIQFDHGGHPLIGSLPIGVPKLIKETDEGLFVRARLSGNWLIEPIRDAISDGAIRGMSIQFSVVKDRWDKERTPELRTITEVKLYELGPVVWPAYEGTRVGVRSAQLAEILSDRDGRAELARVLAFGIAEPDAEIVTSEKATEKPRQHLSAAQQLRITELQKRLTQLRRSYE